MRCNARPGEARRDDNETVQCQTVQCSAVQTVQYAAADAFASFFFRLPFLPAACSLFPATHRVQQTRHAYMHKVILHVPYLGTVCMCVCAYICILHKA